MDSPSKKHRQLSLLFAGGILVLAAIVIVQESISDDSDLRYYSESDLKWLQDVDDSWRNDIHANASGTSPYPSENVGTGMALSSEDQKIRGGDLSKANGLTRELMRLVRAGKSMEELRNSSNPVLERRCVDGMRKLQNEAKTIMSRRKNLVIPSNAPVSLNRVLSNISKCISCSDGAIKFCENAEMELNFISRSLSLN